MGKKDATAPSGKTCGMNAGVFAALAYSVVSIAITLFNKAVLSSYGFDSTMTLTLLQGLVTIISLSVMKRLRYIDYPSFDWGVARKVAPLSFVFIAYVVISLISLGRVNVPMFTALRRVTVVFVMVEEYYLLGIVPSTNVVASVGVMCIGAAIAAWKDLTFDLVSYFYLFLTNLFTSLYTVYINVVKKETGLNIWAMLYYNNVTTMPALLVLAWYTGDLQRAWEFPHFHDIFFQINFQASIFLAFLLNVCTFYCTTLNTARTQTVVGQLKNFVAFLLGLVLFSDYIYEPINFFGLIVGFAGGVLYSWVSYIEKLAKDAAKALAAATGGGAKAIDDGAAATNLAGHGGAQRLDTLEAGVEQGGNGAAGGAPSVPNADSFERDESRGLLRGVGAGASSSTIPGGSELRARGAAS